MPTSLRDLLDDPSLGLELLVGGDLDRPIRWVHVTELADVAPYLAGGELILTAGVWRERRHSAEEFVRALKARDIAGVGYGLLVGDDQVPAAVRQACQEAGVPLVGVPVRTPFVAISQCFVERLAADREQSLRSTLELTAELLSAAEESSATDALRAVASVLRRSTRHDVWIADGAGRLLARAGAISEIAARHAASAAASDDRGPVDGWSVQGIDAGGVRVASIAVAAPSDDLETRSRIDAARPVVGLILAGARAVRESERRLAGEVVSLVLGRQVEVAATRMPYYGLDPARPLLSLVCAVGEREREHALESAERWLAETGLKGVVALRGDELMLVIAGVGPDGPLEVVATAKSLRAAVGATAVGTGSVAEDVSGLRRSLVQARHACELARRRGDGAVVSHDLTGSHSLLLALQDQDVLDAFCESLLTPIEDHDALHGSDLAATLRTFLETGGKWKETAALLHVHVNTLRNRLERIEALSGRKLDSTPDRVDLWLALQAGSAS